MRTKNKSKYKVFVGQTYKFDQRIHTGSVRALIILQSPVVICIFPQIMEQNEMLPLTVMVVLLTNVMVNKNESSSFPLNLFTVTCSSRMKSTLQHVFESMKQQ